MMILEVDEVEVDRCPKCAGVWLDAGELELLFGERQVAEGFLNGGDRAGVTVEKPRKCPDCGRNMAKECSGGPHPVVYDVCVTGHGLWFDAGELAAILEHGSTAPGGARVSAWLSQVFTSPGPG